mmetsp:Transcript_33321/g.95431  ORF Transcript_33321/g.95431 Transcript_33321/m.95431 type:complete len:117 (+) Transcript_33321:235-585(+)
MHRCRHCFHHTGAAWAAFSACCTTAPAATGALEVGCAEEAAACSGTAAASFKLDAAWGAADRPAAGAGHGGKALGATLAVTLVPGTARAARRAEPALPQSPSSRPSRGERVHAEVR